MKPLSVKKFISRAPRYNIQEDDEQSVRFLRKMKGGSPEDSVEKIHSSELLNISATGLAFRAHANARLEMGEKIKIEFPIPGFRQVAWWGTVVRIQKQEKRDWFGDPIENQEDEFIVGVHFSDMPLKHRDIISKEIDRKFQKIEQQKRRAVFVQTITFAKEYGFKILVLVLGAFIAFLLLYFLSRPSINYHPSLGSPWGRRF